MISILRFSAEDTGTYTCFASNSLGADQAATRIYGMKGQIFLRSKYIFVCSQPPSDCSALERGWPGDPGDPCDQHSEATQQDQVTRGTCCGVNEERYRSFVSSSFQLNSSQSRYAYPPLPSASQILANLICSVKRIWFCSFLP